MIVSLWPSSQFVIDDKVIKEYYEKYLKTIPIVDAMSIIHGEWIVCGDGKNVPYLCSHCGKTVPAMLIEYYPHKYCPNCGAKMDGDKDV